MPEGAVRHLDRLNEHFGELEGVRSARVDAIAAAFAEARFDSQPNDRILQATGRNGVHIATLASATSLMRASVGDFLRRGRWSRRGRGRRPAAAACGLRKPGVAYRCWPHRRTVSRSSVAKPRLSTSSPIRTTMARPANTRSV